MAAEPSATAAAVAEHVKPDLEGEPDAKRAKSGRIIFPFRALRYSADTVGDFSNVITPPFDVITDEEKEELYAKSEFNFARVILPEPQEGLDIYQSASAVFNSWVEKGAVKQDEEECLYVLEQRFNHRGVDHARTSFFGVNTIPRTKEDGIILFHEQTFPHKVTDRLNLTKAVKANLGPVMVMYKDGEGKSTELLAAVKAQPPAFQASTIDGSHASMWVVPKGSPLDEFAGTIDQVYIIDGHHRTETAIAYRNYCDEQRGHATDGASRSDYILLNYVADTDPGFIICATHRAFKLPEGVSVANMLERTKADYKVEPFEGDLAALEAAVETSDVCTLGLCTKEGNYVATLSVPDRTAYLASGRAAAWDNLDVSVLHKGFMEKTLALPEDQEYLYDTFVATLAKWLANGDADVAVIVRPCTPDDIVACADANAMMPKKATYVYPKCCSGAVVHSLVDE